MSKMKKNIAIILAGGIGSRFEGDKPKQYYLINGKEMIEYSIEAFQKSSEIDEIVIVLDKDEFCEGRIKEKYNVHTVCGGKTRNESFGNALKYIKCKFPQCEKIIENNAACPLLKYKKVDEYLKLLDEYDYVHTTFKITDALGSFKDKSVNREDYYLIQSPDAYRFNLLYQYYASDSIITHPAQQLPVDSKGYNYFDYGTTFKVTYPEDLEIAKLLLERKEVKELM